jgi:hypothetical protein
LLPPLLADFIPQAETNAPGVVLPSLPGARTPYDTPEIIAARARAQAITPTSLIDTPERHALRQQVENELYQTGEVEPGRQAYLVTGPPAAGKSTIANPLASQTRSLIVDSDMAKAKLPEYGNGEGAMATHAESATIANDLVEVPVEEAAKRAVSRYLVDDMDDTRTTFPKGPLPDSSKVTSVPYDPWRSRKQRRTSRSGTGTSRKHRRRCAASKTSCPKRSKLEW